MARHLPEGILDGEEVPIRVIREAGEALERIGQGAQPVQDVIGVPGQPAQGVGLGGEVAGVCTRDKLNKLRASRITA